MSVLTISRTLGSCGDYIGRKLAQEIGWDYIDKDRIAEIIKDYGIIALDDIYNSVSHFWDRMNDYHQMTFKFLQNTMIAIAQAGDVVVAGRGSYGLLQSYSDIIHVKIQAPFELRVSRQMEETGVGIDDARKAIRHDDKMRRRFIESNFHFSPDDVNLFDIVLDTSIVEPDDCISILKSVYRGKNGAYREELRKSVHAVEIDPILQKHVAAKLAAMHSEKE